MKWYVALLLGALLMTNKFVPVKDNDWQALNIALEDLFYQKTGTAEAKSVKKSSSETSIKQGKTIDGSDGTSSKETIPVMASGDDKNRLYMYGEGNQQPDVGLPYSGSVHGTLAGQTIPSSFFLDLRSHNNDVHTRHITADWLIVHDNSTPWKTIGLTNVDETCSIETAGPIAGGRDQAAAFSASSWVHFYIIYNVGTNDVSALVSASATAPTLPSGYTYFVRVGAVRLDSNINIASGGQINDKSWMFVYSLYDGDPSDVNIWQTLDISAAIPATAKEVFGYFGLTSDPGSNPGMSVSTDSSSADYSVYATLSIAGGYADFGGSNLFKSMTFYSLPLVTAQTIYWKVTIDQARYGIQVFGWVDDL